MIEKLRIKTLPVLPNKARISNIPYFLATEIDGMVVVQFSCEEKNKQFCELLQEFIEENNLSIVNAIRLGQSVVEEINLNFPLTQYLNNPIKDIRLRLKNG